jgi:hypothetical protein
MLMVDLCFRSNYTARSTISKMNVYPNASGNETELYLTNEGERDGWEFVSRGMLSELNLQIKGDSPSQHRDAE